LLQLLQRQAAVRDHRARSLPAHASRRRRAQRRRDRRRARPCADGLHARRAGRAGHHHVSGQTPQRLTSPPSAGRRGARTSGPTSIGRVPSAPPRPRHKITVFAPWPNWATSGGGAGVGTPARGWRCCRPPQAASSDALPTASAPRTLSRKNPRRPTRSESSLVRLGLILSIYSQRVPHALLSQPAAAGAPTTAAHSSSARACLPLSGPRVAWAISSKGNLGVRSMYSSPFASC